MDTNQIINHIQEALEKEKHLAPSPMILIAQDHELKLMTPKTAKGYSTIVAKLSKQQIEHGLTAGEMGKIFTTIRILIREGKL